MTSLLACCVQQHDKACHTWHGTDQARSALFCILVLLMSRHTQHDTTCSRNVYIPETQWKENFLEAVCICVCITTLVMHIVARSQPQTLRHLAMSHCAISVTEASVANTLLRHFFQLKRLALNSVNAQVDRAHNCDLNTQNESST